MARLTTKGQATRERIVAGAAELMYARGVERTSTQDVEKAAGVSSSQIYHYFEDKQSLVRAVIGYQADRIIAVQRSLLEHGSGMAALDAWRDGVVALQVRFGVEGGCPLGQLASELADSDQTARLDLVAGFRRWEAALGDVLGAMHASGELASGAEPGLLALALLTALQGGLLMSKARRDTVALEAALDTVLDRIRQLTVAT